MSDVKNQSTDIQMISIDEIKPWPRNRNKHTKEQIERLADIIKYQGWRQPIVISKLNGFVAAGHGRLEAAKQLGLAEVPVMFQDFDNEEQQYAFMVSDNAIASWAELDLSAINKDLEGLGPDFNLDLLGLQDFVLDPSELDLPINKSDSARKVHTCPECGFEWSDQESDGIVKNTKPIELR